MPERAPGPCSAPPPHRAAPRPRSDVRPRPGRGTRATTVFGPGAALAVVLLAALGGLIAVLATRPALLALELAPGVAQIAAFRVPVAIAALVTAGALLTAAWRVRRAGAAVRATCAALGAALLLVPAVTALDVSGLRRASTVTEADASSGMDATAGVRELSVVSWNALGGAVPAESIAALVRERDADVVMLPETASDVARTTAELLWHDGAGRPSGDRYAVFSLDERAEQGAAISLLVHERVGEYRLAVERGSTPELGSIAAVPVSGDGPTLVAAHPYPPLPGGMDAWREGLAWVRAQCAGDAIIGGDLNATVDHLPPLGSPASAGSGRCADGAVETGSRTAGTWPASAPPFLGAPIDHVLASGAWRFASFEVVLDRDGAGSDHRPVHATLVREPAPAS